MKNSVCRLVVALTAAACIEAGAAGPSSRLVLQSQLPDSAPQTQLAMQFAREVAKRTGGRLEIVVNVPLPGTGWPRNLVPLLGEGKADLLLTYVNTGFREGQVGMLPGLVNSREQSARFLGTPLAQALASRFEAGTQARNLAWLWEKSVIAAKGPPVGSLEDAKDLRSIRAVGPYIDLFREVQASALALPLSEVAMTMNNGLLTAAVVPVWLIGKGSSASQAADSVAVADGDFGFYSLMSIAISLKSLGGLPPDLQRALVAAAAELEQGAASFLALQDKLAAESFVAQGKRIETVNVDTFGAWTKLARDKVWTPVFTRMKLDDELIGLLRGFQ